MPELPEVYTITNYLKNNLKNKKIIGFNLKESRIFDDNFYNENIIKSLSESKLKDLQRIGKRIIFIFDNQVWVVSLGMTGKFLFKEKSTNKKLDDLNKHDMMILEFENGLLIYNDVRKFGKFNWFKDCSEASEFLNKKVGIDALEDFDFKVLKDKIINASNLKVGLLDQTKIAGIGNYLADEICFEAYLHPESIPAKLNDEHFQTLNNAIKTVIKTSIKNNGVSVSDYVTPDNKKGNMQNLLKVYNRKGLECYNCGDLLEKKVVATRGTVYCNNCQKLIK